MQKRRVRVKHEGLRLRRLATVWVSPPAPCAASRAVAPVDFNIVVLVAIAIIVAIVAIVVVFVRPS